jgi:hypothetical protein
MTGVQRESSGTLWLDSLDEYRTDGEPSDKVYGLANAIATATVPRWRLSCRSEDWRKGADIAAVQDTTAGAPIVVVQLLPLNRIEGAAVLVALGEDAPDTFLTKAEALGATGFIESPLSLKLLHKAVAGADKWRPHATSYSRPLSAASLTSVTASTNGPREAPLTTSSQPPLRPAWFSSLPAPAPFGDQTMNRQRRLATRALTRPLTT